MKSNWDDRYKQTDYIYGKEPNLKFREFIQNLKPGKILLPAEGEGRNAVYAAKLGWEVTAFDFSKEGRRKALKLAEEANVKFDYQLLDMTDAAFPRNEFDLIVLIYAHLPETKRLPFHKKIHPWLKDDGRVFMQAFPKEQITKNTGGPKHQDMLYSKEMLREDFHNLEIEKLEQEEIELFEGNWHKGSVFNITLVARKNSK